MARGYTAARRRHQPGWHGVGGPRGRPGGGAAAKGPPYNWSHVIPRYTPPKIAEVFGEEARLRWWLEIELLAVEGREQAGLAPRGTAQRLRSRVHVDAERVARLEEEQGHDVAAFVSAVQETAGDDGRHLHLGLTSSDIVDTALACQLAAAAAILDADCARVLESLRSLAVEHRLTVMPGRTHGVHAEPLSLGVKLANHWDELGRCRRRLAVAAEEVAVGQLSGAVGTHTTFPPEAEEHVCRALGLATAPAATQVLARDRHAAFVSAIAITGAALERLATAIRLLQQTEVAEAEEPFAVRQKGSSAMPHKRNPVLSERICGLARVLRGHAVAALEDVALWHERDISHSSVERVVLPDACAALSYMLQLADRVLSALRIDAVKMRSDARWGGGLAFSQRLMVALVDQGWPRERAYRLVQSLATRARDGEGGFEALARADGDVAAALDSAALDAVFDLDAFLRGVDTTFRRLGLDVTSAATSAPRSRPEVAVEAGIGGGRLA